MLWSCAMVVTNFALIRKLYINMNFHSNNPVSQVENIITKIENIDTLAVFGKEFARINSL